MKSPPGLRLYRLALRAYPRSVRDRDGPEMLGLFVDLVEGAYQSGGHRAAVLTACRILLQVPLTAAAARVRSLPHHPFADLTGDIGLAVRGLRREPHFGLAAVATLALGIGGTTAMFSAINGTLLRPPPFPDPDRLLVVYQTYRSPDDARTIRTRWSYREFLALRDGIDRVATVISYTVSGFNLSGDLIPARVEGETVSGEYFEALGLRAVLGRVLGASDAASSDQAPVLIAHRLWQQQFGGDSTAIGHVIRVNGHPMTVAGVLPPGFRGLSGRADVWMLHAMGPIVGYPGHLTDHQHFHSVFARWRVGHPVAMAAVTFAGLAPPEVDHDDPQRWGIEAVPIDRARVDPTMKNMQMLLFGAGALVLLIGIANLANIMLVRAQTRSREMALRIALGADRWRVTRPLMIEGLLLSVAGGTVGLAIAAFLIDPLSTIAVDPRPTAGNNYGALASFARTTLDLRVFGFALATTLATGLLLSGRPGLRASRTSPARAMATRTEPPPARHGFWRPASFLVVSEVALSTLVLATAALLFGSWVNMRTSDPGFEPNDLYQFHVDPGESFEPNDAAPFLGRILGGVEAIPGVEYATVDLCTPPLGRCATTQAIGANTTGGSLAVERHYVGSNHFRTMGIRLLRGRALNAGDRPGQPRVTVVSENAVRRFWPAREPLGQRVWFDDGSVLHPDSAWEVVGVVRDVRYGAFDDAVVPTFYTSFRQFTRAHARVLVRTSLPAAALLPALHRAVAAVDRDLPLDEGAFVADLMRESLEKPRVMTGLTIGFALAALGLAGVGMYGVIAQFVSQRRREMAIRCAVGATGRRLARTVAARVLALSVIGLLAGAGTTLAGARVLTALLFGVSSASVAVWGAVAAILLATAAVAAAVPIGRAWRLDPASVLRGE